MLQRVAQQSIVPAFWAAVQQAAPEHEDLEWAIAQHLQPHLQVGLDPADLIATGCQLQQVLHVQAGLGA